MQMPQPGYRVEALFVLTELYKTSQVAAVRCQRMRGKAPLLRQILEKSNFVKHDSGYEYAKVRKSVISLSHFCCRKFLPYKQL